MRPEQAITPLFLVLAIACGGEAQLSSGSNGSGASGASNVSGGTAAAGRCDDPASAVPDVPPYGGPELDPKYAFQLAMHNRCALTVWPAWYSTGGLDNSVVDAGLWLPLAPGSDRTVSINSVVREIGFWGRTRCRFDQAGNGPCETGDCGSFLCGRAVGRPVTNFLKTATVYSLEEGFVGGYNVGMRVSGSTCGSHECSADVSTCSDGPVQGRCGGTVACGSVCPDAGGPCCDTFHSQCQSGSNPDNLPDYGDLELTFCP